MIGGGTSPEGDESLAQQAESAEPRTERGRGRAAPTDHASGAARSTDLTPCPPQEKRRTDQNEGRSWRRESPKERPVSKTSSQRSVASTESAEDAVEGWTQHLQARRAQEGPEALAEAIGRSAPERSAGSTTQERQLRRKPLPSFAAIHIDPMLKATRQA